MEFLNDATNVSAVQNLLRTPYWSNYFQSHPQIFGQQRLCAPATSFGIPSGAPTLIPGLSLDPSAQIPMLFPAGLAALAPGLGAGSPLTAPQKVSPTLADFQMPQKDAATPSPPPPISPKGSE
uniref:Homeobox protein B-H2 n=1 Tax=Steinernema glaseri TaxID=37863 RepID=A0A1I8ASR5_9BILA